MMNTTDQSLFKMPLYTGKNGIWYNSFEEALSNTETLTWNLPSILSMTSFHHVCGESTLLREVNRNPWMSVPENGGIRLHSIPPHDYNFESKGDIAHKLFGLLTEEMINACKGYGKGYILLSGGLDSRVVACAIHEGMKSGAIDTEITALTWGLPDSRDVKIAELVARELGLKWENIELNPSIVLKNIDLSVQKLGCMTNAYHLHGMSWLTEHISKDSLVIAGSYGDGIGRAEYSGNHILQLEFMKPFNRFGLIREDCFVPLRDQLISTLDGLRNRVDWKYMHEIAEVERQAQYMRNLIAHSMSIINQNATLYQAFSHKDVYTYMWGIHPSLRTNKVYEEILGKYSKGIAALPWARTNKALSGPTQKIDISMNRRFNQYREWITQSLYDELYASLDFNFFEEIAILDLNNIKKLCSTIHNGSGTYHEYNLFLWLVGLSRFNALLKQHHTVRVPEIDFRNAPPSKKTGTGKKSLKSRFSNNMYVLTGPKKLYKKFRKKAAIWLFMLKHPPKSEF